MDIAPVKQEGFPPAAESLQSSGITAPIKEVLRGDVEPTLTDQCLYLISRDESILYIGQSNNPVNRLKEHLGMRRSAESNLGLLIFCNLPVSLSWQMHFLSLIDSEPCLADYLAIMYERQAEIAKSRGASLPGTFLPPQEALALYHQYAVHGLRQHKRIARDIAEKALIRRYKPCLNKAYNYMPSPLPGDLLNPAQLTTIPLLHPLPHEYLQWLVMSDVVLEAVDHATLVKQEWENENKRFEGQS